MKNGIVIPCYNEAKRLHLDKFQQFVDQHEDYVLCFVNDGSKDNTLEVLQSFQRKNADKVEVYNMPQNGGKAEAVRAGILHLVENKGVKSVGFMDADLSTGFDDYLTLVQELHAPEGSKKMVFGSRKTMEENRIERTLFRSLASKIIGLMIRSVLRLPIHDTQCGAKVFSADLARFCFRNNFVTKWLFDVELFIRARKQYGRKQLMAKPLKEWIHVDGSKITLKDSLEIPSQLWKILFNYDIRPLAAVAPRKLSTVSYKLRASLNLL